MKGEVKNLSYSRFHNEWKWTFFVQKEKKSAEAVCESCLQCSSVPLNLWAFPWSPTTLSSVLIETDPSGSRRWFLQRWFFDHLAFSQVRVIGLVEFSSNCMDLSKVENDGNKIGTTASFDLNLQLPAANNEMMESQHRGEGVLATYESVSAGREKWPFNVLFFF